MNAERSLAGGVSAQFGEDGGVRLTAEKDEMEITLVPEAYKSLVHYFLGMEWLKKQGLDVKHGDVR